MGGELSRVLLIEDEESDALLVRRCLREPRRPEGPAFHLEHLTTLQQGLDHLAKQDTDVVLLDLNLPDSQGLDTLGRLREADAEIPVAVFTAAGDEGTALGALRKGAQDYVVKDDLVHSGALLRRVVRYAMERQRIGRETQRLHDRLRQAEKIESLGVLSAGVALSFNTLLGTVLEETDEAIAELHDAGRREHVKRRLIVVRRTTFRAAQMVDQLRDYASVRQFPAQSIDLSNFVLEMSDFVDGLVKDAAEVTYELERQDTIVLATRLQLYQILVSLVTNAAEAVEDRPGRIAITTGVTWLDRPEVAALDGSPSAGEGRYVFLRVADTGRGMEPGLGSRIFDPFFTTKRGGRGLGLAAVLGILRDLDAVIRTDSRLGEGTAFTVFLPSLGEP
jgi:C4-dicarboxylate-specific signal transduction histidine kinase